MSRRGTAIAAAGLLGIASVGAALWFARSEEGDRPPKPVTARLEYASVDGQGPLEGFSLVEEEGGRRFPLVLEPGRQTPVVTARAPTGRYRLEAPEGWGAVGPGEAPLFRSDLPPQTFWVGRRHTVYVVPMRPLPIEDVDVTRFARGHPGDPVDARRETGREGTLALRVRPEDWPEGLRIVARLGHAGLATPALVALPPDGSPVHVRVDLAPAAPLDVFAIRLPGGEPAANVTVAAGVGLGRLTTRSEVATDAGGRARFEDLPEEAESVFLEVLLPAAPPLPYPAARFRSLGEARLAVPGGEAGKAGRLVVPWPRPGALVEVRPEGATTYGVVAGAWANPGDGPRFGAALPAGRYRVAVFDDASAAVLEGWLVVVPGRGDDLSERLVAAPACTLDVHVRGGFGTTKSTYDLVARRVEDGQEVDVAGATLRRLPRPDATLVLPPGTWRVRAVSGSREGPVNEVKDLSAGTRAKVEVVAPE